MRLSTYLHPPTFYKYIYTRRYVVEKNLFFAFMGKHVIDTNYKHHDSTYISEKGEDFYLQRWV